MQEGLSQLTVLLSELVLELVPALVQWLPADQQHQASADCIQDCIGPLQSWSVFDGILSASRPTPRIISANPNCYLGSSDKDLDKDLGKDPT